MDYELFRCDAFMAADLAFFSATRLAMRTLKWGEQKLMRKRLKKDFKHTRIRLFAPSGVPIYTSLERASDDDVGDGGV
jgi:hypothetical protein